MNNRRNQNSLLFLTTLGVYLGLLVAGGAVPQVIAHSATTRNFELSDEVEVKDDLDNQPDSCEDLKTKADIRSSEYGGRADAFHQYSAALEKLVRTLANSGFDPFSFNARTFSTQDGRGYFTNMSGRPRLLPVGFRHGFEGGLDSLFDVVPKAGTTAETGAEILTRFDKLDLEITSEFNRTDETGAHKLFVSLSSSLDLGRCSIKSELASAILSNTEVRKKSNSVLIVTRLPRGSLDSLLAKDAK